VSDITIMNEQSGISGEFEKGTLEGLSIAIAIASKLCFAIDHGGNEYRREASASVVAEHIRLKYAEFYRLIYPLSEGPSHE